MLLCSITLKKICQLPTSFILTKKSEGSCVRLHIGQVLRRTAMVEYLFEFLQAPIENLLATENSYCSCSVYLRFKMIYKLHTKVALRCMSI